MSQAESNPSTPLRVLIVDDQQVIREGLTTMLGLMEGLTVVGAAVDGDDALRQAARHDPDVILMDLKMPGRDGTATIQELRARGSRARVVVLTTYDDDEWVVSALRAGALGFLTKDAGAAEIQAAITTVADGHAQLDPMVQRKLLSLLNFDSRPATPPTISAQSPPQQAGLTSREEEILAHVVTGLDNTQIATRLCISLATVKTHINHLLSKTRCANRAALIIYAYETERRAPGASRS